MHRELNLRDKRNNKKNHNQKYHYFVEHYYMSVYTMCECIFFYLVEGLPLFWLVSVVNNISF